MEESKYIEEAKKWGEKGDKALKPGFSLILFSNSEERKDTAKEYYQKAANYYKLAKQFDQASQMYLKTAQCERDLIFCEYVALSSNLYVEAANCMKKINTQEAVKILETGIELFCSTGHIRMGAKYTKIIAEWYEEEFEYELGLIIKNNNFIYNELAIKYYLKANQIQELESANCFGYQCLTKAADLMILGKEERFVEAVQKYELVANQYLKVSLLRASVKEYILKALLIYLAIADKIGAARCIEKYRYEAPSFDGSRELILIQGIMNALEENNVENFEQLLYNYNKITPFDKLKTRLLIKIKEHLQVQIENMQKLTQILILKNGYSTNTYFVINNNIN